MKALTICHFRPPHPPPRFNASAGHRTGAITMTTNSTGIAQHGSDQQRLALAERLV